METRQGERLLRLQEVKHQVGLGRTAIYRGVKEGTFPAPVKLTGRARAWRQSEIDKWIAERPPADVSPGAGAS